MSKVYIDDSCINCNNCISACGFSALEEGESKVSVNSNCTLCMLCIDVCPTNSISMPKKEKIKEDVKRSSGILIVAQTFTGKIHPITKELIGEALKLREKNEKVSAVVVGSNLDFAVEELKSYSLDEIYVYEDEGYKNFSPYHYTNPIVNAIEAINPSIVLFGATLEGRSLAPSVAVSCRTGLTADCTKLTIEKKNLIQTRPAYGGNIMADIITPYHRPQMATVRKGVMEGATPNNTLEVRVVKYRVEIKNTEKLEVIENIFLETKDKNIETAKVIFAVGRGVEERSIKSLLKLETENVIIGCSRGVVEKGWLDSSRQIGLSGKSVSPELLITLGISGSVQFLAGINGAKKVIAVNNDGNAPIFRIADRSIIGDAKEVINLFETFKY